MTKDKEHTAVRNEPSDPHTSEGGTLKPCPFCGDDKPDLFDGIASCRKLGCCIGGYRMLVDDWNRRSAPAAGMVVPIEIDRDKHRAVLDVWNECMVNCETLEMAWPKLVKAIGGLPQQPESTGWANLTCDVCDKRFSGFHKLNRSGDRCCPECAEAK